MNSKHFSSSPGSRFLKPLVICSFLTSLYFPVAIEAKQLRDTTSEHFCRIQNTPRSLRTSKLIFIWSYITTKYKIPKEKALAIVNSIDKAANKFGLSTTLLAAIIAVESGFKSTVKNKGNYGLMQINISKHKSEIVKEDALGRILDPNYNLMVGARIFKQCLSSYARGNIHDALILYNRGCSSRVNLSKVPGLRYAIKILKELRSIQNWQLREDFK